jgi:octaprenyl-diphosphate synthase
MRPELTALRLERAAENGSMAGRTTERLSALKLLAGEVVARVEAALPRAADGGPGLAARAARHLLQAGGKRVRPLLVVLAARASGGACGEPEEKLAEAAELVHAATLLHDDVLDDGRIRRGLPAARVLWGNAASVLGGDFLLVRALELTAASRVPGALDDLLTVIHDMIDGEALQLAHRGQADLDRDGYFGVVDGKTASLFAWCGRAGARLGNTPVEPLGAYGLHLGRAFQIVDDVLDVEGDPRALGKSVLGDLREGKLTLPVLYALEERPLLRARLAACVDEHDDHPVALEVADAVVETGAARRARADAQRETAAALAALDGVADSLYKEALAMIARELCQREG